MKAFALALALAVPATTALAMPAHAEEAARFSADTPIEALMADEKAKAVLDSNFPGLATHPAYDMFKGMSLRQVQPYSQGLITDELLAKVGKELAAIK